MKTIGIIRLCIVCASLLFLGVNAAQAEEVRLQGVLILATNEDKPADKKLAPYASKLKKLFKFKHYQHFGEGKSRLSVPGTSVLQLGNGYALEVEASAAGKGKYRLKLSWKRKGKSLIKTTLVAQKGAPAVLGGPKHGSGNLIVILTAR